MPDLEKFRRDLTTLINACSLENLSDTPDYLLADYLIECLRTYGAAVSRRDSWHGAVRRPTMEAGSFAIKRGTYTLHVYKNSDEDFTVDLDPATLQAHNQEAEEAREDPKL